MNTPESSQDQTPYRLDRRRMAIGTLGAGAVGLAALRLVSAQDSTPEAEPSETESEASPAAESQAQVTEAQLTDQFARFDEEVASLQADLDAVGTDIETTDINDLVSKAISYRDQAESNTSTEGTDGLLQFIVAEHSLRSAQSLLKVRLSYAGLPSEEARSSQQLAASYEVISTANTDLNDNTDAGVTYFLATAKALYRDAYSRYESGDYNQASGTARVAASLSGLGTLLADGFPVGEGGQAEPGLNPGAGLDGPGRNQRGGMMGTPKMGNGESGLDPEDETSDQPVEVPAPDFP